jgi:hypothetical protein
LSEILNTGVDHRFYPKNAKNAEDWSRPETEFEELRSDMLSRIYAAVELFPKGDLNGDLEDF